MKKILIKSILILLVFVNTAYAASIDPLPSWNDTAHKKAIVTFVTQVTQEGSPNFVSPAERIATFDNDGTLWPEQPVYFPLVCDIARLKKLAPQHPEWNNNPNLKRVLDGDLTNISIEVDIAARAGYTTEEYAQSVREWLLTARHPKTGHLYSEMVYQPMLELLNYLRANGFKTYIVSGGGIDFMRPWTAAVYGIPPEQVIGSSIKTQFEIRNGEHVITFLPELANVVEGAGKVLAINQYIGHRPIASFGNSDGDLEMLQWTTTGSGAHLALLVHHTDADREWAYDRTSSNGRLDKALDEAQEKGWTVVDMKKDWKTIYMVDKNKK